MLTAAKEETFSALSDPCVFFPLAASEGVPKNACLGFTRKNPAPHQGSAWSNSGKALGIEEVVWEICGGSDDSARYYDPQAGRFLGEDETGFHDGVNFYRYAHNDPIDNTDPTGFTTYKGFPADKEVQLRNAVDEAIKKLSDTCSSGHSCAGADGPKLINLIQNATFVFQPNSKDCGQTGPATVLRFRHTFGLGPLAFEPICCSLASTLVHEAVHGLTHPRNKRPQRIEKDCFGCTVPEKP